MFIIRWIIGRIILFFDFVFSPSAPKRDAKLQATINENTRHLQLYQLPACPFCVKVRRSMKREGLTIDLVNINKSSFHKNELITEGGKKKVPCLRIAEENNSVKWLYESKDIINYIKQYAVA